MRKVNVNLFMKRSLSLFILFVFCFASIPQPSFAQEKKEDKGKRILKKVGKKLEENQLLTLLAAGFAYFGAKRTLEMYDKKEKGDSLLPVFKIDTDYQKLSQDMQGYHV